MLASKFFAEDRTLAASGGNNTYTYTHAGVDYKIHKFTADGTFTVNFSVPIDVLIIGGGGSGASLFGGGGAGGLRWLTNQHIVSGTSAVVCKCIEKGVQIIRVHDVYSIKKLIFMADELWRK